jgi:hypothetical protein
MSRADPGRLAALVDEVGRFYIRDRKMRNAQTEIARALARGGVEDAAAAAYLQAVRRYFEGFEREARRHLGRVERRLAHVAQVQFNLTAERGVAARRVEVTQGVLARVEEVGVR